MGFSIPTRTALSETMPVSLPATEHLADQTLVSGPLEVKLATSEEDIHAAKRLRYQVFYEEMGAIPSPAARASRLDEDPFDDAGWKLLMSVNVDGVFLGMKHVVPVMAAAGGGSIVNLSSISGNIGNSNIHHGYNASKGAVRTMTKSAAVRHALEGVRVNSVHPGLMPPMRTSGATADPVIREKMLKRVPLRRNGRADEVAKAILFLASDDASYVTGSELHVDGGMLAS